jgi:hypothetical protein
LQAVGHNEPSGGCAEHQRSSDAHRERHVECRIGEGDRSRPDLGERDEIDDLKLCDRIGHQTSSSKFHCQSNRNIHIDISQGATSRIIFNLTAKIAGSGGVDAHIAQELLLP